MIKRREDIPEEVGIVDRIRIMEFLPPGHFELRLDNSPHTTLYDLAGIVLHRGQIYLRISSFPPLQQENSTLVSIKRVSEARRVYFGNYGE